MQANHPDKEAVRAYMADRSTNENPPPSPDAIRTQLGWWLVPANGPEPEVPEQ
jgi:hypothetical protein